MIDLEDLEVKGYSLISDNELFYLDENGYKPMLGKHYEDMSHHDWSIVVDDDRDNYVVKCPCGAKLHKILHEKDDGEMVYQVWFRPDKGFKGITKCLSDDDKNVIDILT